MYARIFIALGAFSAAFSVTLGAAGAHALAGLLAGGGRPWFDTALHYQQIHALGLILVGLAAGQRPDSRWIVAAGGLLLAGTLMFSGNLYLRSLAGVDTFRALTPFGGMAFILGWICLGVGALRRR